MGLRERALSLLSTRERLAERDLADRQHRLKASAAGRGPDPLDFLAAGVGGVWALSRLARVEDTSQIRALASAARFARVFRS